MCSCCVDHVMFELDVDLLFVVILVAAIIVVSPVRARFFDSFAALLDPECIADESGHMTGVPLLTVFILGYLGLEIQS